MKRHNSNPDVDPRTQGGSAGPLWDSQPSTPGEGAKRAGMQIVHDNTRDEWREAVLAVVERVCFQNVTFTMEDVRRLCSARGIADPHHVNAWGPILVTAAKRGWCEATGEYATGTRGASHAHAMRVWRSRLVRAT